MTEAAREAADKFLMDGWGNIYGPFTMTRDQLDAFAAQARAEEREACAALIWTWADRLGGFEAQQLIAAIRARGERT